METGQDLMRVHYKAPEAKYSLAANYLLFEHRVFIPISLWKAILNDLHAAHVGTVKMKDIARSFVYWPGINTDIEQTILHRVRQTCTCFSQIPGSLLRIKGPWKRVHIDYAGPVAGTMLPIVVDAFSK